MSLIMNLNLQQRKRLHQITLVATFGGLLFGYDTGVINGAFSSLKQYMALTPTTEGLVMSVLLIGAALGSVFGGKFADFFGRRKYLLFLSFIFFIGALMSALAPDITVLLISRFILGYAVGGASVTAPTFISEVAPTEMRGKLTGLNEVAIVIGQLAAFAINAIIGILWGHLPDVWRYMLMVQTIPAICLFIGMLRSPESPRWLISKNRHEEALEILKQIRPLERATKEFNDITTLIKAEADKSFMRRTPLSPFSRRHGFSNSCWWASFGRRCSRPPGSTSLCTTVLRSSAAPDSQKEPPSSATYSMACSPSAACYLACCTSSIVLNVKPSLFMVSRSWLPCTLSLPA